MKKRNGKDSDLSSELPPGTGNVDEVKTLGDRIRFIWILSGLKREELAERLGVTSVTLTNYANNKRSPTSDFLLRICVEFNVSPSWLLLVREPMFLEYNPSYPNLSPPSQEALHLQKSSCPSCEQLSADLREERRLNIDLASEIRQLNAEIKGLWKENGDLRVAIVEAKARAAPDETQPEAARRTG